MGASCGGGAGGSVALGEAGAEPAAEPELPALTLLIFGRGFRCAGAFAGLLASGPALLFFLL